MNILVIQGLIPPLRFNVIDGVDTWGVMQVQTGYDVTGLTPGTYPISSVPKTYESRMVVERWDGTMLWFDPSTLILPFDKVIYQQWLADPLYHAVQNGQLVQNPDWTEPTITIFAENGNGNNGNGNGNNGNGNGGLN